jgi:hypothetical protein
MWSPSGCSDGHPETFADIKRPVAQAAGRLSALCGQAMPASRIVAPGKQNIEMGSDPIRRID